MELNEIRKEDQLISILKGIILDSPELLQLIDQRAEIKMKEKEFPSCLTRDQLAKIWQISKQTVDRMTDEEIESNGFLRKKIGVAVRFERINPRLVNKPAEDQLNSSRKCFTEASTILPG